LVFDIWCTLEYEDNLPAYKAAILLRILFEAVEMRTVELLYVIARVAVDMDIHGISICGYL